MIHSKRPLPLYLSVPHPCSYLDDQQSSTLFVDPAAALDNGSYSELIRYGFRRSGSMVYAPRCEFCSQCVSVRVPVSRFVERRGQRRILGRNQDVEIRRRPAGFQAAHYALYQRYMQARHEGGDMLEASPADYMNFLRAEWCDTWFLEFLLGGRLIAVAVTDRVEDGLSAVYTFFDPALAGRSLGTLAILRQIEYARELGLDYLYLGYWVRDCRKMSYKTRFRPIELYRNGRWQVLEASEPLPE